MEDTTIVHSPKCKDPKTTKRNLCKDCGNKYRNKNKRLNKLKKKEIIIQKRVVIQNNRSIYSHLLCELSLDKSMKYFCKDCIWKYENACNTKWNEKKEN